MPGILSRRAVLAGSAAMGVAAHVTKALAQETLKVGVLGTLTGPGAPWGLSIDGGAHVAAQDVNDRGGLLIGGRRTLVEIVAYDDQYKAANAVTAVNRLIGSDGVRYILGPIASSSVLAIKPITEQEKVLLFSSSWSNQTFTDSKYIFRVGPTTQEFAPSTVNWIKQNRPTVKRVALVSANDETGWNSQRIQRDAYARAGFEIVAAEHFERQQTDFGPLLTKILATNPASIELDTTPPATSGLIIRQAREEGFAGQFTKFGGFDVAEIVRTGGAANVEGVVGILQADPASPEWARLKARYARFHSNEMGDYTFLFYDAARLLFAALEKAGTTDVDTVAATLEQLTPFAGTVGELHWGGREAYGIAHQLYTPLFLTEIRGGAGHVIGKVDLS